MSYEFGSISANAYVALRTPSDLTIVTQVVPNTTINLNKYGTFPANQLIGRPYYLTYEIQEQGGLTKNNQSGALRVVPATELYAGIDDEEEASHSETNGNVQKGEGGVEYDIVGGDGQLIMRTNQRIIDDSNSQILSMTEIENLKAEGINGKDLISRILDSHSALDQKTAFALAKYTLRKTKKYLKRFTVLPLDVATLACWIFRDKEALKILEMREEVLALIGSWSNIHHTPIDLDPSKSDQGTLVPHGRWLVVDEASGLLVGYIAEKLGVLHRTLPQSTSSESPNVVSQQPPSLNDRTETHKEDQEGSTEAVSQPSRPVHKRRPPRANANTIHLIHSASQPNLSLLKYFHFDSCNPPPDHPLTTHLKSISWLQLLHPEEDTGYSQPEQFPTEVIKTWKATRRNNYYRKQRRWERVKANADEVRAGGFDGLIVASVMQPVTVLRELVPLLRGGAKVVVYSRHLEPLTELADCYSNSRRTAFVSDPPNSGQMPTEDFPVDPSALLGATIQTARAKPWQVLPGRTHPLMTGKGGSDGFIFTATRVLPAEGKVTARGMVAKRRKLGGTESVMIGEEEVNENGEADPGR